MYYFKKRKGLNYRNPYWDIAEYLNAKADAKDTGAVLETIREYSLSDLFFLMYFVLNRTDIHDDRLNDTAASWLLDRCYEVQDDHIDVMHIWARYHYKTSFNSTGLTIQHILQNPDCTNVFLSYTNEIATKFMLEIKDIFEKNILLKLAFDNILFMNPRKETNKWSEEKGICVKRTTSRKERTIEAYGIDSLPTSAHYDHRIYNDVVTVESVYTPERIAKTKDRVKNSHALKDRHGDMRIEGTIYHFNDWYCEEIEKGNYKLRFHPAEDADGNPNFLTREELDKEKADMGPRVYSCQMLLNPAAADERFFEMDWLDYHKQLPAKMNKYILCDPASKTKKKNDYTVIMCIGASAERKLHLIDMIRDKINQEERWIALRNMVQDHPDVKIVGYESYSKDSEIEYMYTRMREEGIYFNIEKLDGNTPKPVRIEQLVPLFYNRQFTLPLALNYTNKWEGKTSDLIQDFIQDEYIQAPFSTHDDMLDCMSRIRDSRIWKNIVYPKGQTKEERLDTIKVTNIFPKKRRTYNSWMGR